MVSGPLVDEQRDDVRVCCRPADLRRDHAPTGTLVRFGLLAPLAQHQDTNRVQQLANELDHSASHLAQPPPQPRPTTSMRSPR